MIRVAVLGAKGYAGCELIKILFKHPKVKLTFLGSRDEGTVDVNSILPNIKAGMLQVEKINMKRIIDVSDVVFLALPHTKSILYVEKFINADKVMIDLSADYRFKNKDVYEKWYNVQHTSVALLEKAVYGLPEINKEKIKKCNLIANPGCYPTAVLLSLLPLLKENLIDTSSAIVVDAKSGASGAGKKLNATTQFCELNENFYAYKVGEHQHMPEIKEILRSCGGNEMSITFVPHLLPIERGILALSYLKPKKNLNADNLINLYAEYYKDAPFVRIKDYGISPQLKAVNNTNYCDISFKISEYSEHIIIMSAIDNLVKGASGQAVQNFNIRFGFEETLGLL